MNVLVHAENLMARLATVQQACEKELNAERSEHVTYQEQRRAELNARAASSQAETLSQDAASSAPSKP